MPRGRPPVPSRLKLLRGNPGKRPLNKNEPKPKAKPPRCPDWLHPEARKKWKQLAPELARLGLLTIVDGDVLAAYCQCFAELKAANDAITAEGRFVKVGGTALEKKDGTVEQVGYQLQPHPAVAMQRSALQQLKSFAALFGLDPSSRSKLHVGGAEAADELAEFLSKSS
jgi:P27 family predicted phage terminase small subunit